MSLGWLKGTFKVCPFYQKLPHLRALTQASSSGVKLFKFVVAQCNGYKRKQSLRQWGNALSALGIKILLVWEVSEDKKGWPQGSLPIAVCKCDAGCLLTQIISRLKS